MTTVIPPNLSFSQYRVYQKIQQLGEHANLETVQKALGYKSKTSVAKVVDKLVKYGYVMKLSPSPRQTLAICYFLSNASHAEKA